jgi:hypothetical protein
MPLSRRHLIPAQKPVPSRQCIPLTAPGWWSLRRALWFCLHGSNQFTVQWLSTASGTEYDFAVRRDCRAYKHGMRLLPAGMNQLFVRLIRQNYIPKCKCGPTSPIAFRVPEAGLPNKLWRVADCRSAFWIPISSGSVGDFKPHVKPMLLPFVNSFLHYGRQSPLV